MQLALAGNAIAPHFGHREAFKAGDAAGHTNRFSSIDRCLVSNSSDAAEFITTS
jgi:hypothetical protein